ncbi:MAG: hypothetical protein J6Y06_08005 [Bacteroidales bacterium]|nr:hypothetical protein [Bacteroidales bacterium]
MKALLILFIIALVILIIRCILKSDRKVGCEKIAPSEVTLASELGLDESHRLGNVMCKTWNYFDANPGSDALTEIHSIVYDRACLVTEKMEESGSKVVIVSFIIDDDYQLPDYPLNAEGQPEVFFEGPNARYQAEEIIKSVLELTDESHVSYQLAGSDGPEHYFNILKSNE